MATTKKTTGVTAPKMTWDNSMDDMVAMALLDRLQTDAGKMPDGTYNHAQSVALEKKATQLASAKYAGVSMTAGQRAVANYEMLGAARESMIESGAGRYENGTYVNKTAKDKAHAASAEANAGKAYKDTAPSTGSLLSSYSGNTPSEAEAYKMANRDGAGTADAAANGKAGRRKKTLLGGYYADSVLGG